MQNDTPVRGEGGGGAETRVCCCVSVLTGEGAADRADGGAEEERGVSERRPSLREEMPRADIPGVLMSQRLCVSWRFCRFCV